MSITCVSWFLTWVPQGDPKSSDKVNSWLSKGVASAIVEACSEKEAWDQVGKAGNTVSERLSSDGHSYIWTPSTSFSLKGVK
jgi:hypothetical protein